MRPKINRNLYNKLITCFIMVKCWKKNELFSSKKVQTLQNRKIAERIEIVDLNQITKQKSTKSGIRGFKRGFLVSIYDEKRFGNIKQDNRFKNKSQATKFAIAYMNKNNIC